MTSEHTTGWYKVEALRCYARYQRVQIEIEYIEALALQAAQGDKRAAAVILLKPKEDTDSSFYYKSLCGDRDTWMQRAQLASSMAIMLGNQ